MSVTFRIGYVERLRAILTLGVLALTIGSVGNAQAQADSPSDPPSPTKPASALTPDNTVEQLFTDFLYYARLGRFTAADASARALLTHPDLNPVELVEIADRDRKSVETLLILIRSSSISESATRVMEVLQRGEYMRRQDQERITKHIEDLGGTPQQEAFAIRGLIDGGEYAVPPLVAALHDPGKKVLWPRIINALPRLQKDAVGPMVQALSTKDNAIRQNLIHALGEIGYSQAIPYLRRVEGDASSTPETKAAADTAVERIESLTGRSFPGASDALFFQFAERYYNEDDAVRADPRLDNANVWYWDAGARALKPVAVPRKIFGPVMSMRCAEETLQLKNDHADAIALWLAADIRREARLGMNVESGDPNEKGESDATRPAVFPRALYFTQSAGPRYAHLVLARAVKDNDASVALGAIEALRVTAGEATLIGPEDVKQPLTQSLRFPDTVVRVRAALALGAALPKSSFADSQLVMPVLSTALSLTGRDQYLIVDRDGDNANRIAGALRAGGGEAIADTDFFRALDRVRGEFQRLSGVFVSTDIAEPNVTEALARMRGEFRFAKAPVVVLTKPAQDVFAEELAHRDEYVERVDAAVDEAALRAALDRVRTRTGQTPLTPDTASSIALQTAETLRRIAVDGRTVYNVSEAAPALIGALSASDERLQTAAASVLALIPAPAAQRAVAHVALDANNTLSLRVAAFGSLAESARNNGNMLEESQINALVKIAREESDLVIRTSSSQALGAVNLATNKASEIIRGYYGG